MDGAHLVVAAVAAAAGGAFVGNVEGASARRGLGEWARVVEVSREHWLGHGHGLGLGLELGPEPEPEPELAREVVADAVDFLASGQFAIGGAAGHSPVEYWDHQLRFLGSVHAMLLVAPELAALPIDLDPSVGFLGASADVVAVDVTLLLVEVACGCCLFAALPSYFVVSEEFEQQHSHEDLHCLFAE